ncbi:MAG: N-acetyltransferase family protein, partial [Candidatus Kariarchaeaceae archaeon]
ILEYVDIIAGESDNITFGPGEFFMTVEEEETFIENTAKSENNTFIVGYLDDELVSIADVHSGKRPRIQHSGELGITVKKKYWRMGIGCAMMQYLIDWARDAGLRKLNLRVREDNHGAIALYRSLGFFDQGTITREFFIRGDFYSTLHMGMELD